MEVCQDCKPACNTVTPEPSTIQYSISLLSQEDLSKVFQLWSGRCWLSVPNLYIKVTGIGSKQLVNGHLSMQTWSKNLLKQKLHQHVWNWRVTTFLCCDISSIWSRCHYQGNTYLRYWYTTYEFQPTCFHLGISN